MAKKTSLVVLLRVIIVTGVLAAASGGASAQTGAIEGVVTREAPPPRRSARRYPSGASGTQQIQQLPVVVYLLGPIPGAPPGADGRTASMVQTDTAFVPAVVAVQVGGTVEFPNSDPFYHNVFSYSNAQRFDLGRYLGGESKRVTFDKPGYVSVFCEVHDFMRAAIVVTENAFHTVVGEDGRFRIEGIPVGEHTLAIWHADHETLELTVTVTSGGTVRVEEELKR